MSNQAIRWEIYKDHAGEFRARFRAGNGEIVLTTSEGYIDKADVNDAIDVQELEVIEKANGGLQPARARVPRIELDGEVPGAGAPPIAKPDTSDE